MTDHLPFLGAIATHPDDDTFRLVFADWLEERGDWRAEFLRLDCTLRALSADQPCPEALQTRWSELHARLSPAWRTVLGRTTLENCENRFLFRCPERWDQLAPTKTAAVRFCRVCKERVYYCSSLEEAREHARQGRCVAVDEGLPRSPGDALELDPSRELEMGLLDLGEH